MKPAASMMPFVAIIAGIAVYSAMDTSMKFASLAVGAFSATFWRSVVGCVLVVPLWLREGARLPQGVLLRLHIIRGVVTAGVATSFFYGLVRLRLAEAIAITFIAPLIALFLAAVVLGEKIGRAAIGASLLGLVGVLVIALARAGEANAHPQAALGVAAVLFSAALYAWNLILQRQQALLAKPAEVAVFQNGITTLTLAVAAPWLLVLPHGGEWFSIGVSSVLQVAALMLASWAYGRAEAQALVPFEYTAFLWAVLLGWIAFHETVELPTIAGAVLIVAGCLLAAPKRAEHIEQTAL
ncbi:MAG: DMT family transporter [Candidatus Andeanibacterium colombiense]|uniref:DMT family transporter n=1 Tax=Candidatus Andeanibacterium colombiense TaxID=3121345 RepID=A0AAJ5X9A7_9SPHN|nr:MAG: DMT family transporter [Sphingomonadaceae bacterium]